MAEDEVQQDQEQQGFDSGVEGVPADDLYKDNTPVFDVDTNEFFNNMRQERNKMRFKNGSKPSQFMQSTSYRKPFYMRTTDSQGQKLLKKVK